MNQRRQKSMRRYKTGQRVEQGGLYANDWGGELVLLPGDLFPGHPHVGWTSWTYAGHTAAIPFRQKQYRF